MTRRRTRRRLDPEKKKRSGNSRTAVQAARETNISADSDNPVLTLQRTIGNQATTELLQRQQEEEGSATMVSSAAIREGAIDDSSYTQELINEQLKGQTPSEEGLAEALEQEAGETIVRPQTNRLHTQHPSIAQMGIRPKEIKGFKVGVYIGNSMYKNLGLLDGVNDDVEKMKSTMEGFEYDSMPSQKNKNAKEIDSILSLSVQQAKAHSANALLMYYAGHGVPQGLLGVDTEEVPRTTDSDTQDRGANQRSFKAKTELTDIEEYSKVMQHLEASVDNGVHTSLIVDACHSGAGTDLFRAKAVEKLSKTENKRVKAVTEQIARLNDLKRHVMATEVGIESVFSGSQEQVGESEGETEVETRSSNTTAEVPEGTLKQLWLDVVRPELQQVATYLDAAGMGIEVPENLTTYNAESIQQQINLFINKLVDLGEIIKQEAEETTLEKAGA